MDTRVRRTRWTAGDAVPALVVLGGAWLAYANPDVRSVLVYFGGTTAVTGYLAARLAAGTRRQVLVAGAALIAIVFAVLLGIDYARGALTMNSCSHDCAYGGEYAGYEGIAFFYLTNLISWILGAMLGRRMRAR